MKLNECYLQSQNDAKVANKDASPCDLSSKGEANYYTVYVNERTIVDVNK